jgi:hypothetical protein
MNLSLENFPSETECTKISLQGVGEFSILIIQGHTIRTVIVKS